MSFVVTEQLRSLFLRLLLLESILKTVNPNIGTQRILVMDQWWLRDDGETVDPGQSPDEIFGSLFKNIDDDDDVEDPFLERASEIFRSTELTNTDYKDLDTLLYNRATCEFQTMRDDAPSSHPDPLLLSPESTQTDQSYSPSGSSEGSEFTPRSPKSSQGSPDHTHGMKGEHCFENEIVFGHTPYPPKENELCTGYDKVPSVSDKKSSNEIKSIETNTGNIDDVLNSFLAQCSRENANGLFDEVLNLPKSCNPPSTSLVPPIDGYVTSSWSPAFSQDAPAVPLTREVNDVTKSRHASEESFLAPRPILNVLTSYSLSNTLKDIFHCQFCGREFKHKIGLKNHERSHLRGETHICGYCGKSFRYKNKLRRHVNVHAREMRICRYCGEVQANDYELVQHEKKHKKDDKKLVDDMMDSSDFTNDSCGNLDFVFTERKSFTPENMMLSSHGCRDQPWTPPYRSTARPIAAGKKILPFPKPVRYHSV
ncbi:Neurotrophin receptor-interacting factor 2 [Holothuria leucospilota]|uniref:Neurotrophin receptor-interacting factor 2 n=1 Tax=Holothuria leucospilota TaxID=206669 RepID=A0A9Q1CIK0_HOLLE|nr:Neurotrophin receptor-interacting factor 2 [Holothuria leucospilota]